MDKKTGRRFQFSLRRLLALVGLCAVAVWGYWIAWPAWCDYREWTAFERPARKLRAGMTLREIEAVFGNRYKFEIYSHANGQEAAALPVHLRTRHACVFVILEQTTKDAGQAALAAFGALMDDSAAVVPDPLDLPTREVYVYRLQTASRDHQVREEVRLLRAAGLPTRRLREPLSARRKTGLRFMDDFMEWTTEHRPGSVEVEYELIHADPKATVR